MAIVLRVLLIEDSLLDANLLLNELCAGGYEPTHLRVDTPEATAAALDQHVWDVVISDHAMPRFSATEALALVRERQIDAPFIIVSGVIDDEAAVEAMRAGANDYLRKDRLARLVPVIERELKETAERRERKRTQEALAAERARAELAERVSAETNHRMKNNLMLLSGVLQMQLSTLRQDSEAATVLQDAITRIAAISVVHEQLYQGQPGRVNLCDVLQRVGDLGARTIATQAEVTVSGEACFVSSKLGSTVAILANELITNAVKYGAPDRNGKLTIRIGLEQTDSELCLEVWNSGNPVPDDFDPERQANLGLTLVRSLVVDQFRGVFTLHPHKGGTLARAAMHVGSLAGEGQLT